MNYALIENGVVINVIVLLPCNVKDFPNAIDVGERPVQIGDTYQDGKFYRDGIEILSREQELLVELTDAKTALETLGYTEEVANG